MIKEWRRPEGNVTYYAELTSDVLRVGETYGDSGHGDIASEVSIARFLAGEYQSLLRDHFGDKVLREALLLATRVTAGV